MSKEGWVCPLCGAANAPWMPKCDCVKKPAEQPAKTLPLQPIYVPVVEPYSYPWPYRPWWQVTSGDSTIMQGVSTSSDKIVWGQQ